MEQKINGNRCASSIKTADLDPDSSREGLLKDDAQRVAAILVRRQSVELQKNMNKGCKDVSKEQAPS